MKKQLLTLALAIAALAATAQAPKQTFTRKVLLEQFTTAQCGYCPAGADRIHDAIDGNNNVIWIKHHAGFGTDGITNNINETMTVFYGGSTFAPAMMLDRTNFDPAANPGPVGNVGNISAVRSLVAQAKSRETYCKLYTPTVSLNLETHHLTGTVSGRFGDHVWDENTRLCIFLIEDSIFMEQHDYYNGDPSNSYSVDYWHMASVRDAVTDMWGDSFSVDEANDMSFTYDFDYILPSNYAYKNCKIVAFVYNYDPTNVNNCQVMNAAESPYFDKALAIGEREVSNTLRLFPNPATDRVVVESDGAMSQVLIVNALGQVVASRNANGAQQLDIDVADLNPGLYILRIQTAQGLATRQLIVK